MSERRDNRRDDLKAFPEWQRELTDDSHEEPRELHAAQNEQEGQSGQRFEPFPGDERREREEERREQSDRDVVE